MSSHFTTPIDSDHDRNAISNSTVYQLFQTLCHSADAHAAINQVLAVIGKKLNVSRVYIFENNADNTYCRNTFEWCNEGISPEMENLQNVSYETDIPNYLDNFSDDGVFYCHDVRDLPQAAYEVVAPQGIKSMLHCAIRQNGSFRGYIGFDECTKQRLWTKEEIQLLSHFSEMLSAFLLHYREKEQLHLQAQHLQNLLQSCSYIVEPETHKLKYADDTILQHIPALELDAPCYKVLMNRQSPCSGCPLESLHACSHDWFIVKDSHGHGKLLMEATAMQWQGQHCCKITRRPLPETHE